MSLNFKTPPWPSHRRAGAIRWILFTMTKCILYYSRVRSVLKIYENQRLVAKLPIRPRKVYGSMAEAQSSSVGELAPREDGPENTEVEELTTFKDADDSVRQMKLYYRSTLMHEVNPYSNQDSEYLHRVYPVTKFIWSGNDAIGALLTQSQTPGALYTKPFIGDILSRFKYFRADTKFTCRINSTNFNSGQLGVFWTPYTNHAGAPFNRLQSVYQASVGPCCLISANSREVVEFEIPYVNPQQYWDMVTYPPTTYQSIFGLISVYVISPLKSNATTSVPTVECTIFANFENVQLAGPLYKAVAQSNPGKTVTKFLNPVEKLAEGKSVKDSRIISSWLDGAKDASVYFNGTPYEPGAKVVGAIAGAASKFFYNLGYSQETDRLDRTTVIPFSSGDANRVGGIGITQKFCMYGENAVLKNHTFFSTDKDYDQVSNLIGIPGIADIFSIDGNTVVGNVVKSWEIHPRMHTATNYQGYSRLLSTLSTFWTGGMKFSLRFLTSSFITTRVRLCWTPTPLPTTTSDDIIGDVLSEVFDINGDTTIDFVIPYMHPRPYLETQIRSTETATVRQDVKINGYLSLIVVNQVVSSTPDASTHIGCVLWACGAEDLRFSQPRLPDVTLNWGVAESATTVDDLIPRLSFQRTFSGLAKASCNMLNGVVMGDNISRMSDFMMKYSRVARVSQIMDGASAAFWPAVSPYPDMYTILLEDQTPNGAIASGLLVKRLAMAPFLFHRGSTRFKVVPVSSLDVPDFDYSMSYANQNQIVGASVADLTLQGTGVIFANENKRICEFEIPFYQKNMVISNGYTTASGDRNVIAQIVNTLDPAGSATVYSDYWFAFGEDYTCGFPAGGFPLPAYDP